MMTAITTQPFTSVPPGPAPTPDPALDPAGFDRVLEQADQSAQRSRRRLGRVDSVRDTAERDGESSEEEHARGPEVAVTVGPAGEFAPPEVGGGQALSAEWPAKSAGSEAPSGTASLEDAPAEGQDQRVGIELLGAELEAAVEDLEPEEEGEVTLTGEVGDDLTGSSEGQEATGRGGGREGAAGEGVGQGGRSPPAPSPSPAPGPSFTVSLPGGSTPGLAAVQEPGVQPGASEAATLSLASAATEASTLPEGASVMDQVRFVVGPGSSTARVRLDPPGLGSVGIRVTLVDDVLEARIEVDTPEVRAEIERHLPELEELFSKQGTRISRVEVELSRSEPGEFHGSAASSTGGDPRQHGGGSPLREHPDRPGRTPGAMPAAGSLESTRGQGLDTLA